MAGTGFLSGFVRHRAGIGARRNRDHDRAFRIPQNHAADADRGAARRAGREPGSPGAATLRDERQRIDRAPPPDRIHLPGA